MEKQEDIKVLLYAADGVGDNYFDVQSQLALWHVATTTVGLTPAVTGCANRHRGRNIIPDITLDQLSDADLASYQALFVPSGGYWERNKNNPEVQAFLSRAYGQGLVISSMCVGTPIFAEVPELTRGKYLKAHVNGAYMLRDNGARIVEEGEVVIDGRIVTGGIGGGLNRGGHKKAPYRQLVGSLIRTVRGRLYLSESSFIEGGSSGEYLFSVVLNKAGAFYRSSPDLEVPTVSSVVLNLIDAESEEVIESLELNKDSTGKYSVGVILPQGRNCYGVLEIADSNGEIEIQRVVLHPN